MIKAALIDWLRRDERLSALVGQTVFLRRLPRGATRGVVLHRVGETPSEHQAGPDDLADMRLQTTCIGATDAETEAIREAVRLRLLSLRSGDQIGRDENRVTLEHVGHAGGNDDYGEPVDGAERGPFMTTLDFDIRYRTATP